MDRRQTFETTMMGTMEAWKSHKSCIGASGLSMRARPAEKQARNESAETTLPLRPPAADLPAFFPNSQREHQETWCTLRHTTFDCVSKYNSKWWRHALKSSVDTVAAIIQT